MRPWLLAMALLGTALAQPTQGVIEAEQIEYRPLTLPDGRRIELIVVQGSPARITLGDTVIEADYLEFDTNQRLVRIVGRGRFSTGRETVEGEDFSIDLANETLRAFKVFITTAAIDIRGLSATLMPGQIEVLGGRFSPCSRCPQEIEDYSFKAKRLLLYPGDRLIAYEVTVFIRDVPVLTLPLLLIPLGPVERQPRLSISQGTAIARAEIALDWPYTAGYNAYGTASLRYYADVLPGQGNLFTNTLLGGRVTASYLGFGVRHRAFFADSELTFALQYTPSFIDVRQPGGKTRDQLTARLLYETFAGITPSVRFLIERDDNRRQRLVEYTLNLGGVAGGIEGGFLSQGYFDLDPNDPALSPSYARRGIPERTLAELRLEPAGRPTFTVGPFSLSGVQLVLGAYQDLSNPANRRVARLPSVSAGRLLWNHALRLAPLSPWEGSSLFGLSIFSGRYYSSGERLIRWDSQLALRQSFGRFGDFSAIFTRNTTEGQTPFRFDREIPFSLTDLRSSLSLTPLAWLAIRADYSYIFWDLRRREAIGSGPLNTSLTLFGNLPWLSLSVRNSYDLRTPDPGTLNFDLGVRYPDPNFIAELTASHIQDLMVAPDRLGQTRNESASTLALAFGLRPYARFELRTGRRYDPPPSEHPEYWEPLELAVTAGTLELDDAIPGARLSYRRDINLGEPQELRLEFSTRLAMLEFSLDQRFDYRTGMAGAGSRYSLTWPGMASLEASGFALLPPRWFGFTTSPTQLEHWEFSLRDAVRRLGREQWRLTYRTSYDPALATAAPEPGGFRNSRLEAFVNLENTEFGPVNFSLDAFAELQLADSILPRTFLQRAALLLRSDFFGTVGLQGAIGYRATYNPALDEITRSALTFDNLAVTVRVLDELYLSAALSDIWDLTGNTLAESPWNFQPTISVVWDRCCWALYGSWDTKTGRVRLAITTPGGGPGIAPELDLGLRFPGREE
ncbi:MAG: hypothetical protein KGZ60_03200 [Truepera sp.]|nr:hypothetical protein [Truepera sp.]